MKRIVIFIAAFSYAVCAHAGGFEQVNLSAAGAGVANAFAATANDASAVAYNPAGIAWLPGVSVSAGGSINFRNSSVKIPGGIAPNKGTEPSDGYLYATWAPRDSRFAGGIGFSPLYVIDNNWQDAFGTASGLSKLSVYRTTADLVYAISSDLAVGMGGDWYVTHANLTQGLNSFQGNDLGSFGGHASLMWKPLPTWSLGAVVRSGTNISISGKANDNMSFKLPDQVTLALAHDSAQVWRLETDVKWTRWSALKNMNVIKAGVVTQPNNMNLRDTLTAMLGLTWTWRMGTQVRIGYAYEQGANRSRNFNPMIAGQDAQRVSLGGGGNLFGIHADLAYQYVFYSNKTATGPYAGNYRDRQQSVMFTVSNQF